MKKESNKLRALLQNILIDRKPQITQEKSKKIAGIPQRGLPKMISLAQWLQDKKSSKDEAAIKAFFDFVNVVRGRMPYEELISDSDLNLVLWHLFAYNGLPIDSMAEEMRFSLFDVLLVNNKKLLSVDTGTPRHVEDGIYIKISPGASLESIKKFISLYGDIIKNFQKEYLKRKKVKKKMPLKYRPNFIRDMHVIHVMWLPKKRLEEMVGHKVDYKEIAAAEILSNRSIKLSPEAVKKIFQRWMKIYSERDK